MKYNEGDGLLCFPKSNCRSPLFLYASDKPVGWGAGVCVNKRGRDGWTLVHHVLRLGRISFSTRGRWFPPKRDA